MTQHAWSKVTILAMTFVIGAALAGRAENLAVRNCTWCHGGAAQGYTPAPRLAGQRYQYLENQLADFHAHTRDNPLSRQYMWGAAANLTPQSVRNLSMYFSTLSPQAADDGDREFVATGRTIYQEGMPDDNIVACVVCHGPRCGGRRPNSPTGRAAVHLSEKTARAVGPRLSRRRRAADARYFQQIVAGSDRGARVVSQLHQIADGRGDCRSSACEPRGSAMSVSRHSN